MQRSLFHGLQGCSIAHLGGRVGPHSRAHCLHEVVVKGRHPRTDGLILDSVCAEQLRNRLRHLIATSGEHAGSGPRGLCIGGADQRPDPR